MSRSAILPEELGPHQVDRRALGELDGNPAERSAQRHERTEHLHVLGRDRGNVDGARDDAAGERGDDLLGGLVAGAVGRLGGRGAEVRRDDDVGVAEQRMIGDRFGVNTSSAAPPTLPESSASFRSASTTSGPRATLRIRTPSLHLASASASSQPLVSGVFGRCSVMKSAPRVDVVGGLGLLDAAAPGNARRETYGSNAITRIPNARARSATSWPILPKPRIPSVFSYSSTPENFERSHAPPISDGMRLGHVARQREQQRHRVLGGGDHVRLRRVGDDDPGLGGGIDVDVVDPHAGPADGSQTARRARSAGHRASSPSGSGRRRTRRSVPRAPRATSRRRRRRRSTP